MIYNMFCFYKSIIFAPNCVFVLFVSFRLNETQLVIVLLGFVPKANSCLCLQRKAVGCVHESHEDIGSM